MRSTVDHALPSASILTNELPRLRSGQEQLQSTAIHIVSQIHQTQKDLEGVDRKLSDLQQSEREVEKNLDDLRSRAVPKINRVLNDDGTLILPLNELASSSFAMFKTNEHGYHFIVHVCPTVDPSNQSNGYLSILISLVRGDYDPLLTFPFKHGISFRLIDQSGQGKDLVSTLEVDPRSPSLARPTSEKNPETGIVNFCSLSELTKPRSIYMKDGVYFIGIFIDFLKGRPETSSAVNSCESELNLKKLV